MGITVEIGGDTTKLQTALTGVNGQIKSTQYWICKDNITFHIMHPPLTQTKSASPLPVPNEFKASPEKVGYGLAKHINSKRYIICHSFNQKIQTMGCYVFPIKMGTLLSKMTANVEK